MHEDFCVAYFVEIIINGIFLTTSWIILHIMTQKLIRVFQPNRTSRMESGNYTAKWWLISWLLQLCVWIAVWITSKYIVAKLQGLFLSHLHYVSSFILLPLRNSSFLEMLVVLIIAPWIIDMIVLWITDDFLKDTSGLYTHHFCFNWHHNINLNESETSEDFFRKALNPLLNDPKFIDDKEVDPRNEIDYSPLFHVQSEHFNKQKSPKNKNTFKNLFTKTKSTRLFEKKEWGSEKDYSTESENENLFGTNLTCLFDEESKTEFNTLFFKIKDSHETENVSNNSTFELCQTTPKVEIISNLSIHKEKYPHISTKKTKPQMIDCILKI